MMNNSPEITVVELQSQLESNPNLHILDVREPSEFELCNLGGTLIPLGLLSSKLPELDKTKEYAVLCRSGHRSMQATVLLLNSGFNAKNIKGGILAWSDKIDNSIPKY